MINGLIYWPGSIQLNGEISGQIFANSFHIKNAFGYYNNYISNGKISNLAHQQNMVSPDFFENNNTGKIIKWLN